MKSLFEQMGGTYREENGYLIPNLTLPEEEQIEIVFGVKDVWNISNIIARTSTLHCLSVVNLTAILLMLTSKRKKCLIHSSHNIKLLKA